MPVSMFLKANVQRLWFYKKFKRLNSHRSLVELPVCRLPASIGVENCYCRAIVRPPAMATLLHARGPLKAPLDWCGSREASGALSLSVEEGIGLPLAVWQESWLNFKGLPKVSEVATNHWVFLRSDWSHVSS